MKTMRELFRTHEPPFTAEEVHAANCISPAAWERERDAWRAREARDFARRMRDERYARWAEEARASAPAFLGGGGAR